VYHNFKKEGDTLPISMSSMKDVAQIAGVSVSTVSRVINNNIPVDKETRLKVEEAIRQLRYKPNLLAKGLRLRSGGIIGLVVPEIIHQTFVNFIHYVEESVVDSGFELILGNTHGDPEKEERFIDSLIRRNVDGIIFSRVSDQSRVLNILEKTNIPIVIIDRFLENENIPSIVLDNYKAGLLAGQHLVQYHHRKIACITGPLNIALSRERLKGFKAALSEAGAILPDDFIYEGDFKFESGLAAVEKFLSDEIEMTAIWAQNDMMAIGALKVLNQHGIQVPEDISLMGMDNISSSEMITPALTTITQPFQEMCQKAVNVIINRKGKKELAPSRIVLEPSLIIRDSTCPLLRESVC